MAEIDGFDSLASKINQIKKSSVDIEKLWDKISKHAKAFGGKASGGGGVGGGNGSSALGLASVSSGGGGGGMPSQSTIGGSGGGGKFSSFVAKFGTPEFQDMNKMFGAGDVLSYFTQLGGAVNTFLPDVTQTMNRATGYYNAGVYGGNVMGRRSLQTATFGTLGSMNAVTSEGSDARVAQFLASRGMTASSDANSTYQRTLRSVGNAGLYMNISNEDAASSIEGLTSARGASNMLRNFGIYTADIATGKEKTQGQIFEELAQRLTAGRGNASVEQTQSSIRRGALGVTIDSFFQGDQQGAQMFKQYMIDRAGGKNMDLSGSADITKSLGRSDNKNPLRGQMALATSNTAVQQAAEENYITGIEAATGVLQLLNVAAAGAAKSLLGIASSFGQLLFGANTTKGIIQGVSSTINFESNAANAINQDAASGDLVSFGYHNLMRNIGRAGALGVAGATLIGGIMNSGDTSVTSGLFNPVGGSGGSGGSGGTSYGTGGTTGGSGSGTKLFDISVAAQGHSVTAPFGDSSGVHSGTGHRGTDYAYSVGADVRAIADGVVVVVKSGQVNTYPGGPRSLGNYVGVLSTAADGKQYTVFYGHLQKPLVTLNSKVVRGQKIGKAGNTGYSTGSHLHLEIVKGKSTAAGTGSAISPSDAAKILGSTALSNGSMTTSGSTSGVTSELTQQAAAMTTSLQNQQKDQLNMMLDIYSGDQSRMTKAASSLANNLGIGDLFSKNYKGTYISGQDTLNLTNGTTGSSGGTNNNNVTIVVQVPDVTSADAIKFASLVKQYLDSNTLMSNTGSI